MRALQSSQALAVVLGFLICSGCVSSNPAARPTSEKEIPFQQVEIGLCEDYPKESRSLESARRDFELLRAHHIHALRFAFPWDSIETAPGKYDWTFWDDFVRVATDEFGIRLIPYVCYTPQWGSTGTTTNFWRSPPKDNAQFAEFLKTIVRRYHGHIHSWEIWNEPDNPEYWEGSVAQFAALFKAGSRAVREADPEAKVVLGGIAWNLEFLRALFEWQQVSPEVDVVNLHCYYETWSSDPMEDIGKHVLRANQIIREYGNQQPIWLAEIGYSDYRRGSYVSSSYRAKLPYEHTPQFQAETLGRAFASALATGKVQLIAWYRIHDLPPTTRIIGDVNNRRLGVLDESGRPKPILQALDFFHALFSGSFRCLDSVTLQLRTIQSDSETHVFEKKLGGEFVISWLRTVSLHLQSTNDGRPRNETIEVLLDPNRCKEMPVFDELGRRESIIHLRETEQRNALVIHLRSGEFKVYDCRQ